MLVGDPDQLASVEAGAVLGDLVDQDDVGPVDADFGAALRAATDGVSDVVRLDSPGAALRESVALLRTVHRFDAGGSDRAAGRSWCAPAAPTRRWPCCAPAPTGLVFHEVADDAAGRRLGARWHCSDAGRRTSAR